MTAWGEERETGKADIQRRHRIVETKGKIIGEEVKGIGIGRAS